jgi:signal recognition particle receptor subunit beta
MLDEFLFSFGSGELADAGDDLSEPGDVTRTEPCNTSGPKAVESPIAPEQPTAFFSQPDYLKAGLEPLQEFADRVRHVDHELQALKHLSGVASGRAVTRLIRELNDFEPAVTFLGQVKAGKTSLVNAMAGWSDLLPSDVNPWTSVVTSLHLSPGAERRETGARFQFMEEEEWDRLVHKGGRLGELANRAGASGELETIRQQIETLREKSRARLGSKFEMLLGQEHEYGYFDKNLLERYICIGDDFFEDTPTEDTAAQGRFADITRAADLYLNSDRTPFRMCLRDTPGINDTFMMREQVTINAVRASRICVVVLSAQQALTSIDMALIRMISSLKARDVVIFVNRIDELPDPAEQIPEIEASLRRVLADHKGPENAEVVFGSAYWANMVLTESLERMHAASTDTLMKYAEQALDASTFDQSPAAMIWHLSGLPRLNRIISERIVTKLGDPKLTKIASSAVTIASGQEAANKVRVQGNDRQVAISMYEVRGELDALAKRHRASLEQAIDDIIAAYQSRADRAHANFVERATHSLITHLETNGEGQLWSYSPTGLRMLLKSAYVLFATRAQSAAKSQYAQAVEDIAELYFRAFGKAVEGIELSVPEVQDLPAPVSIAQTIALDFKDGWWVSWWRRTRGYKAFAKQFNALVLAETQDFMTQLKIVQTAQIREQMLETLNAFHEQNRDIMIEIGSGHETAEGMQKKCQGPETQSRLDQIETIIAALKSHCRQTGTEGLET